MERKYTTTHKGIAAYLLTKGIELLRTTAGTNPKTNKPNCRMEFDIDQTSGREMGDAFFDGNVHGDLKQFYDKLNEVGHEIYKVRSR
jgi:hypothetical protein